MDSWIWLAFIVLNNLLDSSYLVAAHRAELRALRERLMEIPLDV
jgi:hypothetical protein